MDYGELLKSAWVITWRHKYLWLLGLFALGGGGGPFSCSSNVNSGSWQLNSGTLDVADFFSRHWVAIATLALVALLLGIVWAIMSLITEAGLIAGVDDRLQNRPEATLGAAWRAGLHSFWRLLGLVLFVGIVVVVVVGVLLAMIITPLVIAGSGDGQASVGGIVAVVLFALFLFLLSLPVLIVLQIVMNWAFRSLVLEHTGVFASLKAGWRLFRRNVGKSLVVWVLSIGLMIGLGLALALPVVVVGIPIGLLIASSGHSPGPAAISALLLVGLVALVVGGIIKAATTTYFSSYWTIAWRRVTTPAAAGAALVSGPGTTTPDEVWRTAADPIAAWPVPEPPAALSPGPPTAAEPPAGVAEPTPPTTIAPPAPPVEVTPPELPVEPPPPSGGTTAPEEPTAGGM
jgi:hypothetical protein